MVKLLLLQLAAKPLAVWFSVILYSESTHTSFALNISALLFGVGLAKLVSTTYTYTRDKSDERPLD